VAIESLFVLEPTPHTDAVCRILATEPALRVSRGPFTRDALLDSIGSCDALFARLSHALDAELLARARRLKVIATPTTGLTHIDVATARRAGIDILSLRDEAEFLARLPATAELTWALLLAVVRRIVAASHHTTSGGWDRNQFWSRELAGRVLGIIGYGRIGQMVARYGAAFGMTVIAFDRTRPREDSTVRQVPKNEVLETADVLTVHAQYDQGDPPVLRAEDFDRMKAGAIFINTARGELVDEAALIRVLRSGRLGGAGLDVLAHEPRVNAELISLQETHNVVITPHIGGATFESIEKTELFMARKLKAYLDAHR
jgi:D-3-phosphoglycerate dehydrogenase